MPTWFFSAVQVYGTLTIHPSTTSAAATQFLSKQIDDLTRHSEEYLMQFLAEQAWKVSDAPEGF